VVLDNLSGSCFGVYADPREAGAYSRAQQRLQELLWMLASRWWCRRKHPRRRHSLSPSSAKTHSSRRWSAPALHFRRDIMQVVLCSA